MRITLKEAMQIATKKYYEQEDRPIRRISHKVMPEDLSVMLQYSLLGLNATQIEQKMNRKFSRETIREHLRNYKVTQRKLDEAKAFEYLKNFDTSYQAGIEV